MTHASSLRCRHPGCKCSVPAGEDYCSDACRDADEGQAPKPVEEPCLCGHPDCHDSA